MNLPYATKTSACISGITLALCLTGGEYIQGASGVLLSITGVIWFPVSIAVFVHGRQTIDYKIEALRGQRPHTDVPKDLTPRAITWFCSVLATAWAFSLWLN
jgi:hypothetical protein